MKALALHSGSVVLPTSPYDVKKRTSVLIRPLLAVTSLFTGKVAFFLQVATFQRARKGKEPARENLRRCLSSQHCSPDYSNVFCPCDCVSQSARRCDVTPLRLLRIAIGIGFGLAAVFWLGFVFNDTLIEITITLTSAYMVYFVVRAPAAVSPDLTRFRRVLFKMHDPSARYLIDLHAAKGSQR